MPLTVEHAKEAFGRAYVAAVTANGRAMLNDPQYDYDSIDCYIERPSGTGPWPDPRVAAQLKATASPMYQNGSLAFDLPVDDYNDLRAVNVTVPRILIVTVVPTALTDWLDHNGTALLVSHCTYWVSLRGQPATTNTKTKRVSLPLAQQFDTPQLSDMLDRIEAGGLP